MLARLRTAVVSGVSASLVTVEVDVSFGLPTFTMVGLPDSTVRESRDRVRSAIRNTGYEFPAHRITVNLAPASLRKHGTSFDLPVAIGVLAAGGLLERREFDDLLLVGELSLEGRIQPTRGVLPMARLARDEGLWMLTPPDAVREAALVPGLRLGTVDTLEHTVGVLEGTAEPGGVDAPIRPVLAPSSSLPDLCEVRGQAQARRGLEIAAAGRHHVLLIGPPGGGKTMLARRLPGILPPPTLEDAVETTTIHSVAGLVPENAGLVDQRPFRAPHHTVSEVALVGGGREPKPGEVSLAHHGVLFLDEMPEFGRRVLDVLRQPLEEGVVRVSRAAGTVAFPARFLLVGAMNPCPCGFAGDPVRECRCTPGQIERYAGRLSGPLRDRFDLVIPVRGLDAIQLRGPARGEPSDVVRARVMSARQRQTERAAETKAAVNADLSPWALDVVCRLDEPGRRLLERACQGFGLSARAYHRVCRVARTVADLDGSGAVEADHLAEAISFRTSGRSLDAGGRPGPENRFPPPRAV